jgi:hypothetical protein
LAIVQVLTDAGLREHLAVLGAIYRYVALIGREGVQQWVSPQRRVDESPR